jgi:hypothetical protein
MTVGDLYASGCRFSLEPAVGGPNGGIMNRALNLHLWSADKVSASVTVTGLEATSSYISIDYGTDLCLRAKTRVSPPDGTRSLGTMYSDCART